MPYINTLINNDSNINQPYYGKFNENDERSVGENNNYDDSIHQNLILKNDLPIKQVAIKHMQK